VVSFFLRRLQPDLFILIETDFWPNMQGLLNKNKIPSLLVNGRISRKSMESYKNLSFFFKPLFSSFTHLSMQTTRDKNNMVELGVPHEKTHTLWNLKFDTALPDLEDSPDLDIILPEESLILVAGSTHEGEEEILLDIFQKLRQQYQIFLIIAPRNINRVPTLMGIAASRGLVSGRRSQKISYLQEILFLDTIGELFTFYRNADIAFVGGSLVPKGGHNPIEPSILGVPVVFGPHMEDFSEITSGLIEAGGGHRVESVEALYSTFKSLISDDEYRRQSGIYGLQYVKEQQGVIQRHTDLIANLL
jgi:3-deoxy-D-manno-octulosonic-acid transferase